MFRESEFLTPLNYGFSTCSVEHGIASFVEEYMHVASFP